MLRQVILAGALWLAASGAAWGQTPDRHSGYYYPEPESSEVYEARVPVLPGSNRVRRIGFVTVMTNEMLKNPYPPQFAIFAKGAQAEKLIVTALHENSYNTLFRARGLFAMLTAVARGTQLFQENPKPTVTPSSTWLTCWGSSRSPSRTVRRSRTGSN